MANSQLSGLLGQLGMPNLAWWDQAESACTNMCKMLTTDINTPDQGNQTSRPSVLIFPTGNLSCRLSSRNELLKVIAFGTLRRDLFVEVAWQNITGAQERGLRVRAFEVSKRRILLDVSGFKFSLHYIESPELVRSFPLIINVPRTIQAKLQAEADNNVEALRDLQIFKDHIAKYPLFPQLFYLLRAWMISSGLYKDEQNCRPGTPLGKRIACFDGELLRELSWNILMNCENEFNCTNLSSIISAFIRHHEACVDCITKTDCSFYYDLNGPFARIWSDNQFRIVHEEFRNLSIALAGRDSKRVAEKPSDDGLHENLQSLLSRPISQKLQYPSYIRVTMRYFGQSLLDGAKMMQFVEERILDMIQALDESVEKLDLRPWPNRVVEIDVKEDDNPYEGYWLMGIATPGTAPRKVNAVLDTWNNKICVSHRYSPSTMVIRAELIAREAMLQQDLKQDDREWPLSVAEPDPRYIPHPIAKEVLETAPPTPANPSLSQRKLRPAIDVLNRLKHDPAFNLDDYVVGYTDRHAGIQEKAAGAWVGESTDEEWIPQGRIQYFKRVSDEKKVWDRATKYDCMLK